MQSQLVFPHNFHRLDSLEVERLFISGRIRGGVKEIWYIVMNLHAICRYNRNGTFATIGHSNNLSDRNGV